MNRIWVLTVFPEYFDAFKQCGVAGQALRGERAGANFDLTTVDIRKFSQSKYGSVDDYPYGGGAGMVMRADIMESALLRGVVEAGGYGENYREKLHVVFPSPRGKTWNNQLAKDLAALHWSQEGKDLVLICGRYEGLDERFLNQYVDQEFSLGDFILTGGELASLIILDSALRFAPGVLGNKESAVEESFNNHLLEQPQYTRPRDFNGEEVPAVLMSGNHKKIDEYRAQEKRRIPVANNSLHKFMLKFYRSHQEVVFETKSST